MRIRKKLTILFLAVGLIPSMLIGWLVLSDSQRSLKEQIFRILEAQILIERWRIHYNTVRPHSSLSYRPPALEAIQTGWLNQSPLQHKNWYN